MAASSSSQNVELEAAKFLQKFIQESKDEPAELATKLYAILQHMKTSGKEHSMPYQVTSRAIETLIGPQVGDSSTPGSQKDSRKTEPNRKRRDPSPVSEPHMENPQKGEPGNTRKGKMNKVETGVEHTNFNIVQSAGQMDHLPSSLLTRIKQEDQMQRVASYDGHSLVSMHEQRTMDPCGVSSTPLEHSMNRGTGPSVADSGVLRNPNMRDTGKALVSKASAVPGTPFKEQQLKQLRAQCLVFLSFRSSLLPKQLHLDIALANIFPNEGTNMGGMQQESLDQKGAVQSSNEPDKSAEDNVEDDSASVVLPPPKLRKSSKFLQVDACDPNSTCGQSSAKRSKPTSSADPESQGSGAESGMLRNPNMRDTGKALVPRASAVPGTPFKEQQLKQLRAQCLVFLSFRSSLLPKQLHLDIALANIFPNEGTNVGGMQQESLDQEGAVQSSNEPDKSAEDNVEDDSASVVLPPPKLRKSSKFLQVDACDPNSTRGQSSAKRSKPARQRKRNLDLNATEEEEETRDTHHRPGGGDSSRKAAIQKLGEMIERLTAAINRSADIEERMVKLMNRRLDIEKRKVKLMRRKTDIQVLTSDYSHLPEPLRQKMEDVQQRICEKYELH